MELVTMLRVIWRWSWLIVALAVITTLALGLRLNAIQPLYEAQVKIQLTAPQEEDVALYDRYRATTLRDEIIIARRNFTEVLKSREVYQRTIRQLKLQDRDAAYQIEVRPVRDSDFLFIAAQARTPEVAAQIANAHVTAAIAYYGEVRAKPAEAAKNLLAEQLRAAEEKFRAADKAVTAFQTANNIGVLENELTTYQRLIEQLRSEKSRRLLEMPASPALEATQESLNRLQLERAAAHARGDAGTVARYDEVIARLSAELKSLQQSTVNTSAIDRVIALGQEEFERLVALGPRYNVLQENVRQARSEYQLLLNKYTEAVLKETVIQSVSFIQIVEPAEPEGEPVPTRARIILILGLLGSLGLGIMLAFVLEALLRPGGANQSPRSPFPSPAPAAGSPGFNLRDLRR